MDLCIVLAQGWHREGDAGLVPWALLSPSALGRRAVGRDVISCLSEEPHMSENLAAETSAGFKVSGLKTSGWGGDPLYVAGVSRVTRGWRHGWAVKGSSEPPPTPL